MFYLGTFKQPDGRVLVIRGTCVNFLADLRVRDPKAREKYFCEIEIRNPEAGYYSTRCAERCYYGDETGVYSRKDAKKPFFYNDEKKNKRDGSYVVLNHNLITGW